MIELQNISKYYSRNGTVALGLRKINLTLNNGEFVAIVGESGSGKSTLLNVISGLDSYEDGEMLINNEQTSHYSVEDWENYRKKYVGFVFQNYNIIESFTILQNVEAALILSLYDPKSRRKRALEIIERVGLTPFKNTKASKLSGGQMQRTVIARALAKDCPIIACDEPTGNLDSQSAKQVIDLLYEVSKEKLVLVVTHNYKEIEALATRKITLHDGALVEDQVLKTDIVIKQLDTLEDAKQEVPIRETYLMAQRNLLSTPAKTILMFLVLLLLTFATAGIYASTLDLRENNAQSNYSNYFSNSSRERVVVRKDDFSAFTESELHSLENNKYVKSVIPNDFVLDDSIYANIPVNEYYIGFSLKTMPAELLKLSDLKYGRLPLLDTEVVLNINYSQYDLKAQDLLDKKIAIASNYSNLSTSNELTVVGLINDTKNTSTGYYTKGFLAKLAKQELNRYVNLSFINNQPYYSYGGIEIQDVADLETTTLQDNEVLISTSLAESYAGYLGIYDMNFQVDSLIGQEITFYANSVYSYPSHTYTIKGIYDGKEYYQSIYLNTSQVNAFYSNIYQVSLLAQNYTDAQRLINTLDQDTYKTFYPFGTLTSGMAFLNTLQNIFITAYLIGIVGIFFFITYFILRNIMASKRAGYIILRSIGATKKFIKRVVFFELFILSTVTYFALLLTKLITDHVTIKYLTSIVQYLFVYYRFVDYLYIYIIILVLVLLLTRRFNKKIFKDSVMVTFKGEESE